MSCVSAWRIDAAPWIPNVLRGKNSYHRICHTWDNAHPPHMS